MTDDKQLVKYLVETFGTSDRPSVCGVGGIYIWDANGGIVLAGPFTTIQHALDTKSKALDKAIKIINRRKS